MERNTYPPSKNGYLTNINNAASSQNRDQSLRLACFDTLVAALRSRLEFADFDPASLRVWAYEDYEPTIRNAARVIRHFDSWLAAHRSEMFLTTHSESRLFCKKDLAEALGVARPTLDRWIANGWLEGCTVCAFSNGERSYSADAVRRALEKLR